MPCQAVHGLWELAHSLHIFLPPSLEARPLLPLWMGKQEGWDTYWL